MFLGRKATGGGGGGAMRICYLEYLLSGIYQYPLPPTEGLNFAL